MNFQRERAQQDEEDKKNELSKKNVAGKIIPLEFYEKNDEIDVGVNAKKTIKKDKKNVTCWTRTKMLEIIAWYFNPVIYIIFAVAYLTICNVL